RDGVGIRVLGAVVVGRAEPHGAHSKRAPARDVGPAQVADVEGLAGGDAERVQRRLEHARMRLRHAELVREDLHLERVEQAHARQELAHDPAAAEARVADQRDAHAAPGEGLERLARARQRLHLAGQVGLLEAVAEPGRDRGAVEPEPFERPARDLARAAADPAAPQLDVPGMGGRDRGRGRVGGELDAARGGRLDQRRDAQRARAAEVAVDQEGLPAVEGDRAQRSGRGLHEISLGTAAGRGPAAGLRHGRGNDILPPSREFVRTLWPALDQAAAIAAALQGRVPNVPKSGETTAIKAALTIADTAAQEALLVPLLARFRSARLEAEEETQTVELFTGAEPAHGIVVDPIDGTLHFFLAGRGYYAVMAGFAIGDRFDATLVALPREALRFAAVRGEGVRRGRLGADDAQPARCSADGDALLLSDGVPDAVEARLRAAGFRSERACGGAVSLAPLVPGVRG